MIEQEDGVLPSHGQDITVLGGSHDDATVIREVLAGLPYGIVVVAHSYRGAPVAEGAADAPNVRHLVYLTSFMLDEGESLLGAAGGTPPPFWEATPDAQAWIARNPEDVFYNDCPLFAQEAMSQRAGDIVRLDAGDSPFLSRPDDLVKLLSRFA